MRGLMDALCTRLELYANHEFLSYCGCFSPGGGNHPHKTERPMLQYILSVSKPSPAVHLSRLKGVAKRAGENCSVHKS